MPGPTLSYEELEALHDVLEAARCFWHPQQAIHSRAAETLRLVNRLYWRLGEELPKTGTPSKRFLPVTSSSHGDRVEQLLEFAIDLTRDYNNENDPWWADTVFASNGLTSALTREELHELRDSLGRLGLTLELRSDIPNNRMIAGRQNLGPWREEWDQRK
jgi:hypothetical protein